MEYSIARSRSHLTMTKFSNNTREQLVEIISQIAESVILAEDPKDCALHICDLLGVKNNGDLRQLNDP